MGLIVLESNQNHATAKETEAVNSLPASMGMGGGYVPMVVEGADLYNQSTTGEVAKTLNSIKSDSDHVPCVISASKASFFTKTTNNIASVLVATDYKDPPIVVDDSALSLENHPNDSRMGIDPQGKVQTLSGRMGTGGNNTPMAMVSSKQNEDNQMEDNNYRVRRLTPTECERLQGFPDGWTDIGEWTDSKGKVRQTTDSARYKALGNSIGLPPWKWVLKRISAQYERDATMASLFDGISGFPLIWEQLNGRGSCLWASEIEEFCIAVTEKRINGKDTVDLRNP
jgi:DNA (cytosine-5)-methyltransferase 1